MSQSKRALALQDLPPPLHSHRMHRYDVVRSSSGLDETSIVTYEIERSSEGEGLTLRRQVWWFEEETLRWVLDDSNEWWLPVEESAGLIRALRRHLPPTG